MGLKSIILILHCIQICLAYPIDDNQGLSNEAEFSNHFSTSNSNGQMMMSFNHESIPIANSDNSNRQMLPEFELNANNVFTNFPDSIEPITYNYHGGNRPFGIPNLPNPDDVDVFAPSRPSGPPRPYPPSGYFPPSGSYPSRPSPPRPIPNYPKPDPDAEVFSTVNGKPVPFPNSAVLGSNMETLPVVFEREKFRIIPEHIERDIQILPGIMKNEDPVIIEKQNNIILPTEQRQMTPMIVENEPGRIPLPSTIIERVDRPIMIESGNPQMTPYIENQRTLIVERDYQKDPISMVIEKEQNFHSQMIPMENKRPMVQSEQLEPESEKPIESLQMTHFTDNDRDMGFEERNPTEFVPIPQQLPERMKRDKNSITISQLKISDSAPIELKENLIDEFERQSIADNEIIQNESTSIISSDAKNETIKVENIPTISPQPLITESNDKPSIPTNSSESKILEINHVSNTSTINEQNEHEPSSTKHIQISPQASNDGDKKIPMTNISNNKVEVVNTNNSAPANEGINHKRLIDATQLSTHTDEISTTPVPVNPPQQTSTTEVLYFISKNKTITNQNSSVDLHSMNPTDHLDDKKLLNSNTSITSQSKYPIPVLKPEKIPQVQTQTNVYHVIVDLTPVKHQVVPQILPADMYIPPYPYHEPQNFMNFGYGLSFENLNQYNYGMHALSQLYPSGQLDYYKSKI